VLRGVLLEKLQVTVDEKGKVRIWMDYCELKGVQSIEFRWEVGEVPIHNVGFVTQVAKFE
jgi:hypothetical protein